MRERVCWRRSRKRVIVLGEELGESECVGGGVGEVFGGIGGIEEGEESGRGVG